MARYATDLETVVNVDSSLVSLRHISNKLSGALFFFATQGTSLSRKQGALPYLTAKTKKL